MVTVSGTEDNERVNMGNQQNSHKIAHILTITVKPPQILNILKSFSVAVLATLSPNLGVITSLTGASIALCRTHSHEV